MSVKSEDEFAEFDPQWFDSVRQDYYYQLQDINDNISKSKHLLTFLIALTIPLYAVVRAVDSPLDGREKVLLVLTLFALVPWSVSTWFLVKAFLGKKYKAITALENLEPESTNRIRWLAEHYRRCADTNRTLNTARMADMTYGAYWLAGTVCVVILLVALSELTRIL